MTKSLQLSEEEQFLSNKIADLKKGSGSHSPSISSLKQALPEIQFKVDACFLSNPYATDLFIEYLNKEVILSEKFRSLLEFYPAQNSAIAKTLGQQITINPKNIFIGNGASEVIYAVMNNFTKRKIAVILPTFSPYYEFAKPEQEVVYFILEKENDFEFNIEKYLAFIKQEQPDTVILINPNNPNGNYIAVEEMKSLIKALANIETVIIDESFIHFAFENSNYDPVSVANLINEFPNLVIIKSMSKDFGIAGIRAGYGVMNESRVTKLLANGYLWNSNGLAEYFFYLYTNQEFLNKYEPIRKKHIAETQKFIAELNKIPLLKVYPSFGNFVLVELPETHPSQDMTIAMLARYGIYIRNCADKKGLIGDFVRVASRTKSENEQILTAFRELVN